MNPQVANQLVASAHGVLTLGGEDYILRLPTDQDHAMLFTELRRLAKRKASQSLRQLREELADLPADMRAEAIRAIATTSLVGDYEPTPEKVQGQFCEPEAVAFWIHWLARANHPDLKREDVAKHVTEDTVTMVMVDLWKALLQDNATEKK